MALKLKNQVKSCVQLLEEYHIDTKNYQAEKLRFAGVGNRDVYNITAPFPDRGEPVIAGRVEDRDTERSEVMFFVNRDGVWTPRANAGTFPLQDPFVTFVHGELIFGGVSVEFSKDGGSRVVSWRTVFYRGRDIEHLVKFAEGPDGMKDIRLVELPDGSIGVFTRPFGVDGARAVIGYTRIGGLEQLDTRRIREARCFMDQFRKTEWGGVNEAHILHNGLIGVLGHIAYMEDDEIRHYYPVTFAMDSATGARTPLKIIAKRPQFPEGPAKRPDLADVIFSGGLRRMAQGRAKFYAGISDAEAHVMEMDDPFAEYESHGKS